MLSTKYCFLIAGFLFFKVSISQNIEFKLYSKSLREIEEKDYKSALKSMSQFIKFFPASTRMSEVLCNRAVVNAELNLTNNAIEDYYEALRIDSLNSEIYKQRGNLYFKIKNFNAALKDYNNSIRLDSTYGETYALKAQVYKQQGSVEVACQFFQKALQHGHLLSLKNIQEACDTNNNIVLRFKLDLLDLRSNDSDYGYSEFKPIKVGAHSKERLEKFLSQLRDKNGYPISFKYMSSCCPYKSQSGAFGKGLCDTYEVIINNDRRILFLSLYDYEEPRIPVGLYSTYHFKE